jgi:imidazole glycerol phosphate synthase subunit HisF
MLRSRITPCLLVHKKGLVKTVGFKDPKYVGDPINAVKIFNEKEVDELIVLDIDATVEGRGPDFNMIKNLAIGNYELFTQNGAYATNIKVKDFVKRLDQVGVGEIVVNSIDRDGKMDGYDMALIDLVREATEVPITVLGGAGSFEDIKSVISKYKVIGVSAGSLFVFKGKYKAVLISYPNKEEKKELNQIIS